MACHHRIALDVKGSEIGLPEVSLGLLPGWRGDPHRADVRAAEGAHGGPAAGQRRKPAAALEVGLVDELVSDPAELIPAAKAWITANPDAAQPWDVKGYKIPGGTPSNPKFAAMLPAFPANLRKQLKGAPMPAPEAIGRGGRGFTGGRGQRTAHRDPVLREPGDRPGQQEHDQGFFFDLQGIMKGSSRPEGFETYTAKKIVILGAGMMGAGIAYVSARSGMEVILKDVSLESAQKGKAYSEKLLDKAVGRGKMTREAADEVLARITATDNPADAKGADLLIEAVFEDPSLKHKVYAEIEPFMAEDSLLAPRTRPPFRSPDWRRA